ncbi:hypothetical protein CFIO01_07465 [Colletotrichum fioriniae PJ7]|uniref:Uncharacterized protein n=1 Tax=Colletotrichum fioriniae PJ7 TaxID=1445577 RepID=A0A010S274_9PEZI|nr:hypothetical protein CFIO01_07465 [Colletotrichum fioriniae PJ7]
MFGFWDFTAQTRTAVCQGGTTAPLAGRLRLNANLSISPYLNIVNPAVRVAVNIPYLTPYTSTVSSLLPSFAGSGLGTTGALAAGLFSTSGPAGTHGRIGHP